MGKTPTVSIVIVCMNNLNNLYPCLDSIKLYTSCSYETLVVAYLFNDEYLYKLKVDYPWIMIIESNEVRGFAENNNLALRQAKGEYCFVLNDDTFFKTPVIDKLVYTLKDIDAAIISPNILFPDNSPQCCGRPPINWYHYVLKKFKLWHENKPSRYVNQEGIFQSYNVLGAAFLVKTSIFKELGWFDERYFFCPEDIAMSTKANQKGYHVYVNSDVKLYHIGGGSRWSNISAATKPASMRGSLIFYGDNSYLIWFIIVLTQVISSFMTFAYWSLRSLSGDKLVKVKAETCANMLLSVFNRNTAKEIFLKYYSRINK